jgi:DNA processing protein
VTAVGELPDEAWVTALATLPRMGPSRLRALLASAPPSAIWHAVVRGAVPAIASPAVLEALGPTGDDVLRAWEGAARAADPEAVWRAHVDGGVGVAIRTSEAYPTSFIDDIDPPAIVFSAGDPGALVGPRVGIIGTRDCTRYGYDVARGLGAELSEAGVSIVSGLALGIDGAAHAGALEVDGAPPIAVVGSGLDVIYPRQHAALWRQVADRGVLLSEYALRSSALAWHFPARNRLIAALSDVLIVVESQEVGGSMLTVEEALRRGVDHMAVPGPVTSKASAGTNKLLSEGALVARDATDVLVKLGMSGGGRRTAVERRPPPSAADQVVLDAFDWQPATFDQLMLRGSLDLYGLTRALDRLVEAGWVHRRGGWYERIAKPGG